MKSLARPLLLILSLCATLLATSAQAVKAPEWEVSEWLNGEGRSVASLLGKVVVVEFFQLWCPGCNRFSIPLMKKWEERFAGEIERGELVLVSIHTVFEGHDHQNPRRLRRFLEEKGITHLVGVDRLEDDDPIPMTMKRYHNRGTPEMAFIDKQGNLRFKQFGSFDEARAEALLRRLLAEGGDRE